jgi:hypothetical protein
MFNPKNINDQIPNAYFKGYSWHSIYHTFNHGWTSIATLFKLPIRQAKLYAYYNVPGIVFGIYNLLASAIATIVVFLASKAFKNSNPSLMKKGVRLFILLILFLIMGEIYLHNSFEEYLNSPHVQSEKE